MYYHHNHHCCRHKYSPTRSPILKNFMKGIFSDRFLFLLKRRIARFLFCLCFVLFSFFCAVCRFSLVSFSMIVFWVDVRTTECVFRFVFQGYLFSFLWQWSYIHEGTRWSRIITVSRCQFCIMQDTQRWTLASGEGSRFYIVSFPCTVFSVSAIFRSAMKISYCAKNSVFCGKIIIFINSVYGYLNNGHLCESSIDRLS